MGARARRLKLALVLAAAIAALTASSSIAFADHYWTHAPATSPAASTY